MTCEKYWPILNGMVNSPFHSNTKEVFHFGSYKNYCDKSCWVPVPFNFLLDPMQNLVRPTFNLFSHNRNLVHLRKKSGFYFSGGKKNCSFSYMHQGKQLLLQILQILCKKVAYVSVGKWHNERNTIIVALESHGTTTFEYLYFQAVWNAYSFKK